MNATISTDDEAGIESNSFSQDAVPAGDFSPLARKIRLRKVYFLNLPVGVCVVSLETPHATVTSRDRLKQWNSVPKAAQNGLCDIYKDVGDYRAMLAEKKRLADEKAAQKKAKEDAEKAAAEGLKPPTVNPIKTEVKPFDPFGL